MGAEVAGAQAGLVLGTLLGSILASNKSKGWVEKELLQNKKGVVDSRAFFKKIQPSLPKGTILLTNSDLHKRVKDSKDIKTMQFFQTMRTATEGNAAAIPKQMTSKWLLKKFVLPKEFHDKNIIIADDKVHPAIIAHEAGHIIDFDETDRAGLFKKIWKKHVRGTVGMEEAAWDKAPGTEHINQKELSTKREGALGTYRRGRNWPLMGGAIGAGLGGFAGHVLSKHGEANVKHFWNGFTKQAEEVSKEELKEVLKKHEERETPAQEKAESAKEQRIERAAGVEPESHKS